MAETVLLFHRVTDVPFLPKMDQAGVGNTYIDLKENFALGIYVNEIYMKLGIEPLWSA